LNGIFAKWEMFNEIYFLKTGGDREASISTQSFLLARLESPANKDIDLLFDFSRKLKLFFVSFLLFIKAINTILSCSSLTLSSSSSGEWSLLQAQARRTSCLADEDINLFTSLLNGYGVCAKSKTCESKSKLIRLLYGKSEF
jgi:hypothetical protein